MKDLCFIPTNTRRLYNAVLMLGHRLRRWPNIDTALYEHRMFDVALGSALGVGARLTTLIIHRTFAMNRSDNKTFRRLDTVNELNAMTRM